jgi:hypothetical protein
LLERIALRLQFGATALADFIYAVCNFAQEAINRVLDLGFGAETGQPNADRVWVPLKRFGYC